LFGCVVKRTGLTQLANKEFLLRFRGVQAVFESDVHLLVHNNKGQAALLVAGLFIACW
jgi:hypothetical protein